MMNLKLVAIIITLFSLINIDVLSQANQVPDNIEFEVLKDLFDSLGGPSWKRNTNWPTKFKWPSSANSTEFRTWHGVTVVNGDISYLDLSGNNLAGRLPSSILRLSRLTRLYIDNNDLVAIPDFGTFSNRTNLMLKVQNNRLDFSQLERQVGRGIRSLAQTPQKTINDFATSALTIGYRFSLKSRPATPNTLVTWEKLGPNGEWYALNNDEDNVVNTFTRYVAVAADTGSYRWKSTNLIIPGITIQSDPVVVRTQLSFALDSWCFQYKYDGRKRVTHKKVPGADWTYLVYDDRDRLVMTQDGEQRKRNQWVIIAYDGLNRPVTTSLYTHGTYASREEMASGAVPSTNLELLTATYYDEYSFASDLGYRGDQLTGQYHYNKDVNTSFPFVRGMVTGTKVKVLDAPYYMTTVNYYDDRRRIVQTASENYNSGVDRITNTYDFTGKVTATRVTHSVSNVHWKNVEMMQIDGNFVKRVSSSGYGGGSSLEFIPAGKDGHAEATVTETNKKRYFGLAEFDSDRLPGSINYCFYVSNSRIEIMENGQVQQSFSKPSTGDRLRITRAGTTVRYFRNGELIYTSLTPSATALYLDVSLFSPGSTFFNLNISASPTGQTALREFGYDHAGRLLTTSHCMNNGDTVLLSKNEYNDLGQLIDKKLYGKPDGDFSQSIDYRYNIRGWLTSINGAPVDEPDANDGDPDSKRDLFGINLRYNDRLSGLDNIPMFTGNISAMQWRTNLGLGDTTVRAYTFRYDPMHRLTDSKQKVFDGQWRNVPAFTEDNLKYDLNGNIMSLRRMGAKGSTMDKLTYNYGAGTTISNQLLKVNDGGDPSAGFTEGSNTGDDYAYDRNGNMTVDNNKGIAISYNILNLPGSVLKRDEGTIQYYYDASGRKLSQVVKDAAGAQKTSTDYHGDFIYENDTLKFVNTEEGRVVMTDKPEYQFHLKDHLGNVRMTFTTKDEKVGSIANFEMPASNFLHYNDVVKINSELFDHTDSGDTRYSARLNGSPNERFGLAKSLSVMPGDTIRMEVFAKYLDTSPANWSAALNALISSIADGTAPVGTFVDGGSTASTGGISIPWSGFLDKSSPSEQEPKAYLNYLLFDRDYNFIGGNAVRLSNNAREYGQDGPHEKLEATVLVTTPGYVYIYLSNDNVALGGGEVEVYFDDFHVEHVKGPVVEMSDYYPFGLVFNSYSKENSVAQDYKYNGKEEQDELGLGWLDYGARMYQPEISRWGTTDIKCEQFFGFSPYNYVYNNPVKMIDPDGKSGEVSIDSQSRTITVTSNIILYGSSGSSSLATNVAADIQNQWNSAGGKVTIDGAEYSVQFVVNGSYNSGLSDDDITGNTHIANNFIKISDSGISVSYMDGVGANTGEFLLKNIQKRGSTTEAHEMGHGWGAVKDTPDGHPVDSDLRGKGQPGIMQARGTLVDAEYQYDPNAKAGDTGGTLNPDKRKVTQIDIDYLGLDKLKFDQNGKAKLGTLTNEVH